MIKILRPDLSSNILEIIDLETNTHFYINGRDLTGRIFEFKDMYAVSVSEPEITLEYKNKFNYFNVAVLTSKNLDPTSYLYNSDLYQYATDLLTSFNESSGGGSNTSGNSYVLPIASASILGGVKIGSTLTINGSGILNVLNPTNNLNGSNGITRTGNFFKLGGNLDSPTFLNLNGTGYLNIGSSTDWNHTFSKTGGLSQSFNGNNAISYSDIGIQFKSLGGSFAKVDTSLLSTTRDYKFPNKSGTFAMLSDITGGGGENTTAGNGLSMSGNIVKLGGNLTENTILNGTNFNITFNVNDFIVNASTNTILLKTNNVENLKIDYTGLTTNNKKTELISGLSSFKLNKANNDEAELIADNFSIKTDNDVTIESGNLNINSGGTKFASVITTGLTDNRTFQFPDVSGMLVTNNILNSYETFGSNGITKVGNTFNLGGNLNQNTTITTGSNALTINGTNSTISILANNLVLGNRITFNKKSEFNKSLLTTNNSITNLLTDSVDTNTSNLYKIDLTNVINSTSPSNIGDGNRYIRTFNVKNISGVLTLGTIQSDFTDTENTSSINIYITGTTLKIDVQGITSRNINWYLNIEKIKLEI